MPRGGFCQHVGPGRRHLPDHKIRIGVEGAYPPFSEETSSGDLVGFDIDIAKALCAECPLVKQDWDGIIPALLARKYDAIIALMSITEERKKKVDFTNKYYNTPARFVLAKGSAMEFTEAGMAGKRVGVQRGTTHNNYITDNSPVPKSCAMTPRIRSIWICRPAALMSRCRIRSPQMTAFCPSPKEPASCSRGLS